MSTVAGRAEAHEVARPPSGFRDRTGLPEPVS